MRTLDDFVQRFLLPLVRGGTVHVGAPWGPGAVAPLLATVDARGPEPLLRQARRAVAAELIAVPPGCALDEPALRLALAAHDLLFLAHPAMRAPTLTDGRRRAIIDGALALAALPEPEDEDALVERHTVLHLLPSLRRTDVRVAHWAGEVRYVGREPPPRVTAWPSLRRVREERREVPCLAEAAARLDGGADLARALLAASPLTDLLHPSRSEPPLDLARLPAVLAHPALARAVAYAWLDEGLERTAGPYTLALLDLLDHRRPAAAQAALALLAHLHLCALLDPRAAARPAPDPAAPPVDDDPALAELFRAAARHEPGLREFCGLYAALHRVAPELALPPDLPPSTSGHAAAALRARLERHVVRCAAASARPLDELVARIARAIGTTAHVAAPGG